MIGKLLSRFPHSLTCPLTVVVTAVLVEGGGVNAQTTNRYDPFCFGVCYYPEQWPESYWEEDARRMQECGLG